MPEFANDPGNRLSNPTVTANEQVCTPFDNLTCIDETAITLLDSLTPSHVPDTSLIQGMPARDLNTATAAVVRGLQDINVERISRPFNWWERITGKDIEQRIRFDIATQGISDLINDMEAAHTNAEAARDAVARDALYLLEANKRLSFAIKAAASCTLRLSGDRFHVERFNKRIADLETLAAANRMLEAHYTVSYQLLVALLDRTTEVSRVLLPLWRQNAFAIANGGVGDETERSAMKSFGSIQKKICAKLLADKEIAA